MDRTIFWQRTDLPGLERLNIHRSDAGILVSGALVTVDDGGFSLAHEWRLDPDWRTVSLIVDRHGPAGHARVQLERVADGWHVDGDARPDLAGCAEPDLSATPFCNALAIRTLGDAEGATFDLDAAYIDAAALTVVRSAQRYERIGERAVRYIDLGVAAGFTAELVLDHDGLVQRYQHLFERVYSD